jgi:hypothetical protein
MMTSPGAFPPTQRHGDQCYASACPVCWLRHFNVEEPRNTTLPAFKHSIHSVCTVVLLDADIKYHMYIPLSGCTGQPRGDLPDPGPKPDKEALPYRAIINQGRGDDNLQSPVRNMNPPHFSCPTPTSTNPHTNYYYNRYLNRILMKNSSI